MAGFRKAKAEQAALKIGLYGPPGSGKTFTSLLVAEGLAKISGKRIAFVDTEHGTDFYCQAVSTRAIHPQAFDFDAIYTRSITETLIAIKSLPIDQYAVVVLDSITHLWTACIEAYGGRQTSAGTIPMHAWGKIKKPYKELMAILLSSPMHVLICGRQGTEYATNEETEELQAIGVKMKAEGETPYEPHILLRMEAIKPKKTNEVAQIIAFAEKDRTGILAGRSFINPTFDSLCKPLLGLLGATQARVETVDETAGRDAEQISKEDAERSESSQRLLRELSAKIMLASSQPELKKVGATITPQTKAMMITADVATLRENYQAREREIGTGPAAPPIDAPDAAPKEPSSPAAESQPGAGAAPAKHNEWGIPSDYLDPAEQKAKRTRRTKADRAGDPSTSNTTDNSLKNGVERQNNANNAGDHQKSSTSNATPPSNAGASGDAAQESPTPSKLSSTAAEPHSEPARVSDDAIEFCSGPWREFVNRLWAMASEVNAELSRLEFENGITKNARIWPKATDGTHSVPVDKRALIVEAVKAKRMNYKTGVIETAKEVV